MKTKFSKTISALLSAFLLLAAGCGGTSPDSSDSSGGGTSSGSGGGGEVTFDTYGSYWFPQHDYKTMPVGAYNSVPSASYGYTKNFLVDEEIFRAYAEAGVNMMMGLTDFVGANQADVATALDFLLRITTLPICSPIRARTTSARKAECEARSRR